jgi:hypothetical protein
VDGVARVEELYIPRAKEPPICMLTRRLMSPSRVATGDAPEYAPRARRSRSAPFAPDGAVLQAPAVKSLDRSDDLAATIQRSD